MLYSRLLPLLIVAKCCLLMPSVYHVIPVKAMGESVPVWTKKQKRSETEDKKTDNDKKNSTRWKDLMMDAQAALCYILWTFKGVDHSLKLTRSIVI